MSEPDMLFDGYPDADPPPDPYEGMGQDARRTARQREQIDSGVHPATKLPLANNGHTCGDCALMVIKDLGELGMGSGRYFKCRKQLHGIDHVGTDLRRWWPACTAWEDDQ